MTYFSTMKYTPLFLIILLIYNTGYSQLKDPLSEGPHITTIYFERIFENDTVSIWLEDQVIVEDIILKEVACHGSTHTTIQLSQYFGSYAVCELNHLNPHTRKIESQKSLVLMPYLFSQNEIKLGIQINSKIVHLNIQVKEKHIYLTRIPYDLLGDRTRDPEFKVEYSYSQPYYR